MLACVPSVGAPLHSILPDGYQICDFSYRGSRPSSAFVSMLFAYDLHVDLKIHRKFTLNVLRVCPKIHTRYSCSKKSEILPLRALGRTNGRASTYSP